MPKLKKTKPITNKKPARKSNPMKKQQVKLSAKKTTKKTAQKKSPQARTTPANKNITKKTATVANKKVMKKTSPDSPKTTICERIKNTESFKPVFNKQTTVILVVMGLIGLAYIFRGVFIAAMVNGQPISRLKIIREAEKAQGQQILENYVLESLIEQKARVQGVQISDEAVNAQIEEIKQSVTEQGQDFEQLMALQGLTMKELQRQIRVQQMIDVMVGAEIEVSDEAVAEYLENNKDFLPDDMEQDELETLAKQQLQQQEMSQKYQKWLDNLKEEANVRYFGGYGEENNLGY